MKIELQAGQWYRTNDGIIVYCLGESKAMRLEDDRWIVESSANFRRHYHKNGTWDKDMPSENDIVEHLPDCDSFTWVPPQPKPVYRPFANAAEFAPHRDRWILRADGKAGAARTSAYEEKGLWFGKNYVTYEQVFRLNTFEDGTPFGVLENKE